MPMTSMLIGPADRRWHWVQLVYLLLITAIGMGIWKGPSAVFWVSGAGLAASIVGIAIGARRPEVYAPLGYVWFGGLCHFAAIMFAWGLRATLLVPIPAELLSMPALEGGYRDDLRSFSVSAPKGWSVEPVHTLGESGLVFRPTAQVTESGVGEVRVWVRPLEAPPKSPELFVRRMAETLSIAREKRSERRAFETGFETISLPNGKFVVATELNVSRLWIPMRQVAVYGMVDETRVGSVQATGYKAHAALAQDLCVKIFQTIQIPPSSRFEKIAPTDTMAP